MATDAPIETPQTGEGQQQMNPGLANKLASIERATGVKNSSLNSEASGGETPPAQAPPELTPEATSPTGGAAPVEAAPAEPEGQPETSTPPEGATEEPVNPLSLESEVAEMNSRITGEVKLEPESAEPETSQNGFESWEDFEKFITGAGYDGITKDNAAEKLTEVFDKSKKYVESSEQLKNYKAVFENLPDDLMTGVRAWADGEDYRSKMNSVPSIDFGKEFRDHDSKEMIEAYFPGKITPEEWAEYGEADADPEVKAKIASWNELSEQKYRVEQESFNNRKEAYESNAKQVMETRQQAFDNSRNNFPKAFEESTGFPVREDYIAELDKNLKTQQDVLAVFYDQNGALKEEAYYRMAMALDGKDLVSQQAAALKNRMITKAREEVISNAPSETAIRKTGDQTQLSDAQKSVQKVDSYVSRILPKPDEKTY